MKKSKIILIVIGITALILIVGVFFWNEVIQKESAGSSYVEEKSQELENKLESQSLGSLCSGEESCKEFCLNNRGQCESYCNNNENHLCSIIFPPEEPHREEPLTEKQTEIEIRKGGCEGTKTKFDYAPVNLDKTKVFLPLGLMIGNHVTPIDHHYFQNFDNEGYDIEIYSPGKGMITGIGHMPGAKNGEDYRVVIEHTCTISSIYIHLGILAEKFKKYASDNNGYGGVGIPVEAGELIGYYEKNVDYNLVDEEVILEGFVTPQYYEAEVWKIHVPNTHDYFNEPIRSKLIEKSIRTAKPISGKIDYDIDGKLVGNWFVENTGGYRGGGVAEDYWTTHLSFAYDAYDPQRIVISIGGYGREDSRQFGVKMNSPDPAQVEIENGLVKYELVNYNYIAQNGSPWDRKSLVKDLKTVTNEMVEGVVLVQMIKNRKIKFEVFPGKNASQVSGFTNNAKVYER